MHEGRGHALPGQELTGLGPAFLRTIAEREQRLSAVVALAEPGDGHHVVRLEILTSRAGRLGERAIRTCVVAQRRQRDEHFAAVGHRPALGTVAIT